jgi:hypothetical protein
VLQRHHEALEIDLLGRGIDLLDFWRGRMTPRRLWLLIRSVLADPKSALYREVDPDGAMAAKWSPTDWLLADLYDLTFRAAGGKNHTYPRPTREGLREQREQVERAAERYRALEAQAERSNRQLAEGSSDG